MNQTQRLRRMTGYLAARLPELRLGEVEDPRSRLGKRWQLEKLLRLVIVGQLAGNKSLAELEQLSSWLGRPLRQRLELPGRVPDTTLRDLLCRLPVASARKVLHRAIRAAHRRKALEVQGLPFHMVALDGKATALPSWDPVFAQRHQPDDGSAPHGLLRTTTATLVTATSKPCIDVSPIPARTNEMGHFKQAFGDLVRQYGKLFTLVSYDAGASSAENGRIVRQAGKHYLFRLVDERWNLYQLGLELLATATPSEPVVTTLNNKTEMRRTVRLVSVNDPRLPSLPRKSVVWKHARTLAQVDVQRWESGVLVHQERRLYISSLEKVQLSPTQWVFATVGHWSVETTHQTLDVAFREDERPWVVASPQGALAVLILRRVAYTLLSLFRSVTQRSELNRLLPWRELMAWVAAALLTSSAEASRELRPRSAAAVCV